MSIVDLVPKEQIADLSIVELGGLFTKTFRAVELGDWSIDTLRQLSRATHELYRRPSEDRCYFYRLIKQLRTRYVRQEKYGSARLMKNALKYYEKHVL